MLATIILGWVLILLTTSSAPIDLPSDLKIHESFDHASGFLAESVAYLKSTVHAIQDSASTFEVLAAQRRRATKTVNSVNSTSETDIDCLVQPLKRSDFPTIRMEIELELLSGELLQLRSILSNPPVPGFQELAKEVSSIPWEKFAYGFAKVASRMVTGRLQVLDDGSSKAFIDGTVFRH